MAKSQNFLFFIILAGALGACDSSNQTSAINSDRLRLAANANYGDFGEYTVQVNALTTDQLPAEVAKTYGIMRSANRVLLNITILKKMQDMADEPVSADIVVAAANLTGQAKNISIRKITEQKAIYYIGETAVSNRETLIFDIDVTPENLEQPLLLRYQQDFFAR